MYDLLMLSFFMILVLLLALIASIGLLALSILQTINPLFRFWPPPKDPPWKKWVFVTLFRILVYGLIISSSLHIWRSGLPSFSPEFIFAIFLFIMGFFIAFASTKALGWSNAFGAKEGLITNGIFRYSRNPIYIATWCGLAGWALIIPVPLVVVTLFCWGLLYVVAIFMEEHWLAQEYGESYLEYCRKVRRFF